MPRPAFLLFALLLGCASAEPVADAGAPPDSAPLVAAHDASITCSHPRPTVQISGDHFRVDWRVRNHGTEPLHAARASIFMEDGVVADAVLGEILPGDESSGTFFVLVPPVTPAEPVEYRDLRCVLLTMPDDERPDDNVATESGGEPLRIGVHGGV